MKNSTKIIIAALVVVLVPIAYYMNKHFARESLVGCYIARTDKTLYTLTIQSHQTTVMRGLLSYRNYQMDSSAGTFEGSYLNDVLRGDYASRAEGTEFTREIIFKRDGDSFVQGYGEMQSEGNRQVFVNAGDISFEGGVRFVRDESCGQ